MTEPPLPTDEALEPRDASPEAPVAGPDPLMLRLDQLPAVYGPADLEPEPLPAWRRAVPYVVAVAILIGVLVGMQPFFARVRIQRALDAQIARGNFTAAQASLERFALGYPTHPALARYRGIVALGQADWASAETHLREQVRTFPGDGEALRALGFVYGMGALYQVVPVDEAELRKAMIQDWTRLFGYTIAGVDPSLAALPLQFPNLLEEAIKHLARARTAPEADQASLLAALAGLEVLAAKDEEALLASAEGLKSMEEPALPSFLAYTALATGQERVTEIAEVPAGMPPPIANGPEITPLPEVGPPVGPSATPGGPALDWGSLIGPEEGSGRGGGDLSGSNPPLEDPQPALDPSMPTNQAFQNEMAAELARGPEPTVKPFKVETYLRKNDDGTETPIKTVRLLNIYEPGGVVARSGESVELPGTGTAVTVKEIAAEGSRIVLEEGGKQTYIWHKSPGAPWYWELPPADA